MTLIPRVPAFMRSASNVFESRCADRVKGGLPAQAGPRACFTDAPAIAISTKIMIQMQRTGAAVPELISIIVTTYERPDALALVLRALAQQTDRDFEILVADDGSGPETAELVKSWTLRLGVPLRHVWHEHRGFRAGEIRNRAILASRGPYCIFLDGDCITRPDFVTSHRKLAERGWFVTGNRMLLSTSCTKQVLQDEAAPEAWTLRDLVARRCRGEINRLLPALSIPLGPLRKLRSRNWEGARSCNLAVWRSNLDRVDGFDSAFSGWGLEDSDLLVRLLHAGVRRKNGAFATGVLHLWHPQSDRSSLADNRARLDAVIASDRVQAERGLSTQRSVDAPDSGRDLQREAAAASTC
jgi:glycosyltransferase involved in cell wall biosynthesis